MSSNGFLSSIPPVTRNLLFINIILFMVQQLVAQRGGDVLTDLFGLHFFLAPDFHLWQVVTYMFLHGSWSHVLLNMFSLWMFGRIIERTMGQRRFIIYYFLCGVGAALCQELWQLGQYYLEGLNHYAMVPDGVTSLPMGAFLNTWVTIGASGACYGVLLAFGMTFPDERIMLLFPPIPMKAKYFVIGYALIEVFSAFYSNGNIAHFAHLGGMFFGWLYFRNWRRQIAARSADRITIPTPAPTTPAVPTPPRAAVSCNASGELFSASVPLWKVLSVNSFRVPIAVAARRAPLRRPHRRLRGRLTANTICADARAGAHR